MPPRLPTLTGRRWAQIALGSLLVALGCRTAGPDAPTIRAVPESPAEEAIGPAAVTPAEPLASGPPAIDEVVSQRVPLTLRVGLLTDQPEVSFPCCEGLVAVWPGSHMPLEEQLVVIPAPSAVTRPVFRLQVAALRDEAQARLLAARLEEETGGGADVVLDAESGLHRVRLGRYASRDEAERAGRGLARYGIREAWPVTENGLLHEPALALRSGSTKVRVPGRWLAVEATGGRGVPAGEGRYRGRMLAFLNDRGLLNVVNELDLEEYLRGVVPLELGPDAYPELEALKAQAVAARTYTVRNLWEFDGEGFDICATPRCQVYGGMRAEHPRSDRAIAETAGEVMVWRDRPIDALYSSTCGGHTEDVGTVFPLKAAESYLSGVACAEAGPATLSGRRGTTLATAVADYVLPPSGRGAERLARRLDALASRVGIDGAGGPGRLASLAWPEVRRAVGRRFDLALDARLLSPPSDLAALAAEPPAGWDAAERRLAVAVAGIDREVGARELPAAAADELLFSLVVALGAVEVTPARFQSFDGTRLAVRIGGERVEHDFGSRALAVTDRPGARSGDLAVVPGDRVELVTHGAELLAVVHPDGLRSARSAPSSKWSSWQRFRSDQRLARLVAEHLPGFELASFEVTDTGVSGRVAAVELTATDGRRERLEGLAVRWTFDVPDTLFTVRRTRSSSSGAPGWLFTGRGWGHGVGLCQTGAYAMAVRGHGYRDILDHYYTGVTVEHVSAERQVVRQSGGG